MLKGTLKRVHQVIDVHVPITFIWQRIKRPALPIVPQANTDAEEVMKNVFHGSGSAMESLIVRIKVMNPVHVQQGIVVPVHSNAIMDNVCHHLLFVMVMMIVEIEVMRKRVIYRVQQRISNANQVDDVFLIVGDAMVMLIVKMEVMKIQVYVVSISFLFPLYQSSLILNFFCNKLDKRACDPETEFNCKNGRCIPKLWMCDFDNVSFYSYLVSFFFNLKKPFEFSRIVEMTVMNLLTCAGKEIVPRVGNGVLDNQIIDASQDGCSVMEKMIVAMDLMNFQFIVQNAHPKRTLNVQIIDAFQSKFFIEFL